MVTPGCVAVVVLAALGGCGSTTGQQAQSSGPSTTTRAAFDFTLPFDRYRFSDAEQATIQSAQNRQTASCAEREGASWTAPKHTTRRPELSGNLRRYGLIEGRTAREYGYHLPPDSERRAQQPDERVDACKKKASGQLWRGVGTVDWGWFEGLNFTSADRSAAVPEVLRVTAEWSRCMKAAGFSYADPVGTISDPRWKLDSPEVSADEIAVATTDVRCKVQTGLVGVRAAAETRIQLQLIAATPVRFAAIERAEQQILANARRMLIG